MNYNRNQNARNFASNALTKAVIYFTDGNSRKFYSHDGTRDKNVPPNKALGIQRLRKMVFGWQRNVVTAVIYCNKTEQELHKFKEGAWLF